MEKLNGNGAECMVKFIADGCKGHIHVNDGSMVLGETAWRKHGLWQLDWLDKSCTYFPPEPQWLDCSAGEALDAMADIKAVQYCKEPFPWEAIQPCLFRKWDWAGLFTKYRKEA